MLLVPSSYLGRIYRPHIASGLARRLPDVRLVAVDDVLFREGTTVDGFDEVIPTAHLSDPRHAGRPAVNCAYSLSAWLTLDRSQAPRNAPPSTYLNSSICWIFRWSTRPVR
ncbi:hypothetical protein P4114_30955 [Pseudomonas aeruginosa]|nr:hypothetical protein [Pseudomonas aeruginosa]